MVTRTLYTNSVALNGTADVTALAAPASGNIRVIVGVVITNTDTAAISPVLMLDENGTQTPVSGSGDAYQVGETFERGQGIVLDTTTDTLKVKLGAAITTSNPRALVKFYEVTP